MSEPVKKVKQNNDKNKHGKTTATSIKKRRKKQFPKKNRIRTKLSFSMEQACLRVDNNLLLLILNGTV